MAPALSEVSPSLISSSPHDLTASEEDHVSFSSTSRRGTDRGDEVGRRGDEGEEGSGVTDFFPSEDRAGSAEGKSRQATFKEEKCDARSIILTEEGAIIGSIINDIRRAGDGLQIKREYENEALASTSYKWNDADRWLTLSAKASDRGGTPWRRVVSPTESFSDAETDLRTSFTLTRYPQSSSLQTWRLIPELHHTQGERMSEGRAERNPRATMRDIGTEYGGQSRRDMGTQSSPPDTNSCQSPAEECPLLRCSFEDIPGNRRCPRRFCAPPPPPPLDTSPPRHNTPTRRSVSCSGGIGARDCVRRAVLNDVREEPTVVPSSSLKLLELEKCHLDKLKLTRLQQLPDIEDKIHFVSEKGVGNCHTLSLDLKSPYRQPLKLSMLEARVSAWEDVQRAKYIARFKREEAKIEAWESLQCAEADAELRKLEVKLEKMRFEGREKILRRLTASKNRAQEMLSSAEAHKSEQLTRLEMRANQIRKSGHIPSSTFNVMCSLTTKIKPSSNSPFK
ncbi:hypothetical protein KP509_15G074300 [Ceratopteris richardii]|uniref:Remorin C-terminal domain-containing protein n=1 Tax=Ceratopteris richardii TaxID=49495 RepID=A0A8T2T9D7_CERRI|nr:hypothetical protein KP509_15G074300 [Ceratopteris richardii]